MLICDTHADTLYAMQLAKPPLVPDVTLERLTRAGDTRVQALALFVGANGMRGADADIVKRELRQLERLKTQGFHQITEIDDAVPNAPNVLLTVEGGEAFGQSAQGVDDLAALGVRAAAIVWNNENLLAHPAAGGSAEGLKPFGREVVARMRQKHMAVDISHLNDAGAWEVLDGGAPPMASHSCARALCAHPRNLSDELARALFKAGGYIGVNFYARFLSDDGRADIDRVIDHIAHFCELGGETHVGLGSDFDGIDEYPAGLRHAGELYALLDGMRRRGFDAALVKAVAGENFRAYMKRS